MKFNMEATNTFNSAEFVTIFSPQKKSNIKVRRTSISLSRVLLNAVKENDVVLVSQLLKNGANPNARDECHYTALHWATIYNKPELVHCILNDSNCNVDACDKDGYTSMHLSIKFCHQQVLQFLIMHGADLDIKTKGGRVAEDIAISNNSWEIVQILQTARQNKHHRNRNRPRRWELGKCLGCGAFGQVYLGKNKDNGKELAIKCIRTYREHHQNVNKQIEELDNEINLLSSLIHVNILKYYGFDKSNPKSLFLFMEYLPGGSMRDLVHENGGLEEDQLRLFVVQILEGVAYLHNNMVIHRDIKGANILLDSKQTTIKLADFGLSKRIERCSIFPKMQSVIGSPYWMAPEVVKAKPLGYGYGRRADIWSFGCTVIEMFSTLPPFSSLEPMAALYNIGSGTIFPEIPANMSDSLQDLVKQCLKRNPRSRPSAGSLLKHPFIIKENSPIMATNQKRKFVFNRSNLLVRILANPVETAIVHVRKRCSSLLLSRDQSEC